MALSREGALLSALRSRDHCVGTGLGPAEPVGTTKRGVNQRRRRSPQCGTGGSCRWEAQDKDRGQKLSLSYLMATETLRANNPRHFSMLQHES